MASGSAKTIVASLLIAGAGLFLYVYLNETPPLTAPKAQEAIGLVMGEHAARLARDGGRITVIARDTSVYPSPATDFQLKGFAEALAKARVTKVVTNLLRLDPGRAVRVPAPEFLSILKKQQDGDVIASFLGPARLEPDQRSELGAKKVHIVALCSGGVPRQIDLRALFETEQLQVAVISRTDAFLTPPDSGDLQTWFRHYYRVITPVNLAELPLPAEGRSR